MNSHNLALAVIVLYNPVRDELRPLIKSLIGQVKNICVVDNSEVNNENLFSDIVIQSDCKVNYMPLFDNKGIAEAQNVGISFAKKMKFEYVLLLDQDSFLPNGMVDDLIFAQRSLKDNGIKVAAVGPSFIDVKSGEICGAVRIRWLKIEKLIVDSKEREPVLSDYIIASGSLISLDTLKEVGCMREDLFIDWVDIEWGERANRKGYASYIVPNVVMQHSIGDESIQVLGRNVNIHSDFRNYYIIRNTVNLLFSDSFLFKSKVLMSLKFVWYVFLYTMASKNKFSSVSIYLRAVIDGFRSNMNKGYFK